MDITRRIEYIDALRGFTMTLVVAVHIYNFCFMQGNVTEYSLSFNNFFGLFRMPLFYFISGFVFYKYNRIWDFITFRKFISSKIRVQLFSTIVFLWLFCFLFRGDLHYSLYDSHKSGYWFTYVLFIYFIIYIGIDTTICWISRKTTFNNYTIITSLIIGLILYYFINNGILLNILSPQTTTLLSIQKWQFFLFFSFGCFIHKYYDVFLKLHNNTFLKDGILLLFVCCTICIFYQNCNVILIYTYILKLFTALCGIILVMYIFKDNESYLSKSTKLGKCLQYIGKHTLDIYFLHYFFLPYNLSTIGRWLDKNPNPLLEFCMSLLLALIVMACCLFFSKIIRISPTLAYLLLGAKRKKK